MTPTAIELEEFRTEVRNWLLENRPPDPGFLLPQTFMEVGSEQQLELSSICMPFVSDDDIEAVKQWRKEAEEKRKRK